MKVSRFLIGLLVASFSLQSHALFKRFQELPPGRVSKPERVEVEFKTNFSIQGSRGEIAYTEFHGANEVSCLVYNHSKYPVTVKAGTSRIMRAVFWPSEASWTEDGDAADYLSISCGGGETGSEIRGYDFDAKAIPVVNRDMRDILSITDITSGK